MRAAVLCRQTMSSERARGDEPPVAAHDDGAA